MSRRRRTPWPPCGFLVTLFVLLAGCLSHPRLETVLYGNARAVVSLKEFSDASFRARHPAVVDPGLLVSLLAGLRVQEHKTMIESSLTGEAPSVPVFTPSEAEFLAPLLADALNRATAAEAVRFRVPGSDSSTRAALAGALYVTPGHAHVLLTQYGPTPQRPPTLSRPSQSFDRGKRWTLTFVPEQAMVSGATGALVPADAAESTPLVVSLQLLERARDRGSRPLSQVEESEPRDETEAMEQELRRLRQTLQEQEQRLEQLERELEKR